MQLSHRAKKEFVVRHRGTPFGPGGGGYRHTGAESPVDPGSGASVSDVHTLGLNL